MFAEEGLGEKGISTKGGGGGDSMQEKKRREKVGKK